MRRKRTPHDYHQMAKSCNYQWLGPEVKTTKTKTLWLCNNGHQWETTYKSLQVGNRCTQCIRRHSKKPDDYHRLAESKGLKWLGPKVSNVQGKTIWLCPEGHRWEATYNVVQQREIYGRCGLCRRVPEKDYHELANDRNFQWLGPYRTSNKKTGWQCSEGHKWEAPFIGLFHFIFGDWPYNLESILKRFGGKNAAPARRGSDGAFQRQSAGFMGQVWDGSKLAYQRSTWRLLSRLLHPGGFTASFSHARTAHRLATAQEEAGFLINPTLDARIPNLPLSWIYSTGKPNGTSVTPGLQRREHPLAEAWEGYQYGCPLSPEYEPVVIAQKPYEGNPVDSIARTGAGAYNIAGGKRFQTNDRFPGTLSLVHHPACMRVGYKEIRPNGFVNASEDKSKTLFVYNDMKQTGWNPQKNDNGKEVVPDYDCHPDCPISQSPGPDKAHYFAQVDWTWEVLERLSTVNPYFYEKKVSPRERNAGCQGLPEVVRKRANRGGYANTDAWKDTIQYNPHPTLKPIKLVQCIASLFLPPKEYAPRRALVCCSGTGSEVIGCLLAGWDEVIGVELMPQKSGDPDYCGIADKRVGFFYEFVKYGQTDVDVILDSINLTGEEDKQLSLLDLERN